MQREGMSFFYGSKQDSRWKIFCIWKKHFEHTCDPLGEGCKVNGKWVAKIFEQTLRTHPSTRIDNLIDNAKLKYGVKVPKIIAYITKKEVLKLSLMMI